MTDFIISDINTIATSLDLKESALNYFAPEVLAALLRDHTTQKNIIWCTDDYAHLGEGFLASDEITIDKITGSNGNLIRPRALKSKENQRDRTREKAEVFTPSWVCNAQCNLVDGAWFGREGDFNTENEDRTWTTNPEPITFPEGKTLRDYVHNTCLEITCGEAPYLVSRYDAVTAEMIPLRDRIGLLDRKLRVISENIDDHQEWLKWVQAAYQSIYGFEWQGDNLLLARENLLQTFLEYHAEKFGKDYPLQTKSLLDIAYIISWNLWQMDGLKCVIPNSCGERTNEIVDLFGDVTVKTECCQGCKKNDIHRHNGIYCKIMDWEEGKEILFVSMLKNKK